MELQKTLVPSRSVTRLAQRQVAQRDSPPNLGVPPRILLLIGCASLRVARRGDDAVNDDSFGHYDRAVRRTDVDGAVVIAADDFRVDQQVVAHVAPPRW